MKAALTSLLTLLESHSIIREVQSGTIFYDEPKFHYFTTEISRDLPHIKDLTYELTAGGISAASGELALLKCLMESVERYSLYASRDEYVRLSYDEITDRALNPMIYTNNKTTKKKVMSWTEGYDVYTLKKTLIPAQLVDLNKNKFAFEENLTPTISTGTAAGLDHKTTLLGGIYELVERDGFMTMYLNRIPLLKIRPDSFKSEKLSAVIKEYERYNLEVSLFEITNDLSIPVYLSIIVDRTGIGPAVTIGVKAHMNNRVAAIGSLEEAFMARPWLRVEMAKRAKTSKVLKPSTSRMDRALLWSDRKNIKELDFLLKQPFSQTLAIKTYKASNDEEYDCVIQKMKDRGYEVYYKDITAPEFSTAEYRVYKTLIPGLQPLYLYKEQFIMKRLADVATYFSAAPATLNMFPHPFL